MYSDASLIHSEHFFGENFVGKLRMKGEILCMKKKKLLTGKNLTQKQMQICMEKKYHWDPPCPGSLVMLCDPILCILNVQMVYSRNLQFLSKFGTFLGVLAAKPHP
jgi:hypothetical protein